MMKWLPGNFVVFSQEVHGSFPVGSYHLPTWIANLGLNYDAPNSIDLY